MRMSGGGGQLVGEVGRGDEDKFEQSVNEVDGQKRREFESEKEPDVEWEYVPEDDLEIVTVIRDMDDRYDR